MCTHRLSPAGFVKPHRLFPPTWMKNPRRYWLEGVLISTGALFQPPGQPFSGRATAVGDVLTADTEFLRNACVIPGQLFPEGRELLRLDFQDFRYLFDSSDSQKVEELNVAPGRVIQIEQQRLAVGERQFADFCPKAAHKIAVN